MARPHVICHVSELPPGARKIVQIGSRSIGLFNLDGTYYALRNQCPHQLAPLCQGAIVSRALPSQPGTYSYDTQKEIIRCPWHGWEFDIKTGRSVFNPHRVRVKSYEVRVESVPEPEEDPSVETFPVKVEEEYVVLYA